MAQDVEDHPVGVDDEEPPDTPRFVGERVDNLQPTRDRLSVDAVHVRHLEGYVRMDPRRVVPHDADLGRRVARRNESHDPVHVPADIEAQEASIEFRLSSSALLLTFGTTRLIVTVTPREAEAEGISIRDYVPNPSLVSSIK